MVKRCISKYYKKKIHYKKPNDLFIQKKKICGILQEKVNKFNNTYLIVGIGINLIKSPFIKNYPTTHLRELINKDISKKKFELKLKKIFESNLNKLIKQ